MGNRIRGMLSSTSCVGSNQRLPSSSPETVFILRSLSNFESLYLSKSSNKLNEVVAQAFAGGVRAPPGYNEGINIARTVANELDSARFDPLLVRSVAKNALASLDMLLSRVDGLVRVISCLESLLTAANGTVGRQGSFCCDTHGSIGNTPTGIECAVVHMSIPMLVPT